MIKSLENTSKKMLIRKGRGAKCDFFCRYIDINSRMREMGFNFIYLTCLTNRVYACYVPGTVLSA